jgi:2,4-dienoyl-CoA reductase-like NADH-dependent reductase (Old Yellow Enzyme family)
MTQVYARIAQLKTLAEFRDHLDSLGVQIPVDSAVVPAPSGPLAQPYVLKDGRAIGNRFCVQPMEGWDGSTDGRPTDLVFRRWRNFGLSGAKVIWGGEAAAVRPDGRANPNQLMMLDHTMRDMERLRQALVDEHKDRYGQVEDLMVGLQLTHSGRFSRPNEKAKLEPKILYHHPLLDGLFNIAAEYPVMTDAEIDGLIGDYILAAKRAHAIGFDFVDVKHCHGYLGHEFLSAVTRPGKYGGSFENRARFMREIVKGIKIECPGLRIGVRFSSFDMPPFRRDEENVGRIDGYRDPGGRYPYAFGADPDAPGGIKLDEPVALMKMMEDIGVELVNFSAGSPYYTPHLTRPAYYPPSDGYLPPEDPLVVVARHIQVAAQLKAAAPKLACVGSSYSYLQEWIPNVAQAVVEAKKIDFVGLGRSTLSYPDLPADVLAGHTPARNRICRTFSDCTTAPRKGLVSGCYPLDDFYRTRPEAEELKRIKRSLRSGS